MCHIKKIIAIIILCLCILMITGCKRDFNPYDHMHLIMTSTSMADYENNKEFIDAHTSPDLQNYVHSLFYGITGAVIEEREIYFEDSGSTVKLLGCYVQTVDYERSAYWVYMEYQDDILISCHIYPTYVTEPF